MVGSTVKGSRRCGTTWLINQPGAKILARSRSQGQGDKTGQDWTGLDWTEVREINLGIEAGGGNGEGREAWMESPLSGAPAKIGKARQAR